MKKSNYSLFLFLLLSSCQWFLPSSQTSPGLTSSSSTVIPIPNDVFNPNQDGRVLLREIRIQETFSQVTLSPLLELPLSPINFPVTENIVTAYQSPQLDLGNVEEEVIVFQNSGPQMNGLLSNMALGETLNTAATFSLLETLQPTDERLNQLVQIRSDRNLSFPFIRNDSYYWFNNYYREEQATLKRYPNEIIYGEGTIDLTFQTLVNIKPIYQYQRHADFTTIYEIYDETYPSGFFGAQDYQYRTPRVMGNFKHALTLGPSTVLRDTWRQIQANQKPTNLPLFHSLSEMSSSLQATKTSIDTLTFTLNLYTGLDIESAKETYQIKASIQQNEWLPVERVHYFWA
jgi:hypothetical protein